MIQEGLIWTYYDCSHACYLFGKYDLSCNFMYASYMFPVFFVLITLLFILKKFSFLKKINNTKSQEMGKC